MVRNGLLGHVDRKLFLMYFFLVDEFVNGLLSFPSEADVITEAVHSVSQTIDSRHFAEEFIRRRKLADKGMVDTTSQSTVAPSGAESKAGGWSEVAKKGPTNAPKEEPNNFKVVAAKRRGGKR
jgi:PERQ amino acid-rich with GYF domain-containing protein